MYTYHMHITCMHIYCMHVYSMHARVLHVCVIWDISKLVVGSSKAQLCSFDFAQMSAIFPNE